MATTHTNRVNPKARSVPPQKNVAKREQGKGRKILDSRKKKRHPRGRKVDERKETQGLIADERISSPSRKEGA